MAFQIKGITIDFNANTTKLDQAFRKLNVEANAVQRELRGINTLLKMNPGIVALASQKTQLLKKSIAETELKQKELNAAMAKANAEGVNRESAAYRKLEREIELTNAKLKQLKREQLEWTASQTKIGKMSAAMTAFGAKANAAASKVKYLSLAAAGIGAIALKAGMNFEEGMSKVQAITGATGDEIQQLREKAKEMGAQTKFSATEASEAMQYMAMAGWKTEDMLGGISGIMDLAAASGEDLATTSDIVTDALTAFGLKAEDSGHFADVLAAASSNANTNVKMMGETFKYAAPIAGSLGYSVEDVAEGIGLMANAGIKSSQAGTSLRRILTSLTKDFKISGKKIGEVTIETTKADGSMRDLKDILADTRKAFSGLSDSEKTTAAETLVGKNAMSGFLAMMDASPKDIKKLEDALGNADGAAKSMADTMLDNTKGSITILKSTLESAAISISETLAPMLTKVVEGIRKWVEKFNDLSPATKDIITKMLLFTAAGYPILKLVGGMATGIGAMLKPLSLVAARFQLGAKGTGAFTKLLAAVPGPAKLAVGAVVGLAAAYKIYDNRIHSASNAYKQSKKEREESIVQSQAEASEVDYLNDRLHELMEVEDKSAGQKATIKKIVEELNDKVEGLNLTYDEERDALNKGNDAIKERIDNMKTEAEVAAYQDAITSAFKSRLKAENDLEQAEKNLAEAKEHLNNLNKDPGVEPDQIQSAAAAVKTMQDAYDDAAQAVADCDEEIDDYNNKILKAKGETKDIPQKIYYASSAFNELKKKAGQTGYAFSNTLIKGMREGKIKVPTTVKGINKLVKFDDAIRRAKAQGINVDDRLKRGLLDGKTSISKATSTVEGWIEDGIDPNMKSVGHQIDSGIASGMLDQIGLGFLSDAFGPIADFIIKGVKKKFGINSPAKIMIPMGEGLTEGIAKGMIDSRELLNVAGSVLAQTATGISMLGSTMPSASAMVGYSPTSAAVTAPVSAGTTATINNNITVSGAQNPDDFAAQLARSLKMQLRTI